MTEFLETSISTMYTLLSASTFFYALQTSQTHKFITPFEVWNKLYYMPPLSLRLWKQREGGRCKTQRSNKFKEFSMHFIAGVQSPAVFEKTGSKLCSGSRKIVEVGFGLRSSALKRNETGFEPYGLQDQSSGSGSKPLFSFWCTAFCRI